MLDKVIAGISVASVVIGLTELAKTTGLPSKAIPWVAVGIAVVIGVADQFAQMYPVVTPWLETIIVYLVIGLSATGLYKVGSNWFKG